MTLYAPSSIRFAAPVRITTPVPRFMGNGTDGGESSAAPTEPPMTAFEKFRLMRRVALGFAVGPFHRLMPKPIKGRIESQFIRLPGFKETLADHVTDPLLAPAIASGALSETAWQTKDGLKLYGWFHKPQPGKPTLILSSGQGGGLVNNAEVLTALAQEGYGCLAFDYRGHGCSQRAHGSEAGYTEDIRSASNHVAQTFDIPVENQILVGHSMGTPLVLAAAGEKPYQAICLLAPIPSAAELVNRTRTNLLMRTIFPDGDKLLNHLNFREHIGRVQSPLLIIRGEKDFTPATLTDEYKQLAQNARRCKVVSLPEVGHNVTPDILCRELDAFLQEN